MVHEFRSQLLFNIYKRVCSGEKEKNIYMRANREWLPFGKKLTETQSYCEECSRCCKDVKA